MTVTGALHAGVRSIDRNARRHEQVKASKRDREEATQTAIASAGHSDPGIPWAYALWDGHLVLGLC